MNLGTLKHLPGGLVSRWGNTNISDISIVAHPSLNMLQKGHILNLYIILPISVWDKWSILVCCRSYNPDFTLCNDFYTTKNKGSRSKNVPPGN